MLCEFEITANICVYNASTIFTFADWLGNESGSHVVSLSDHVFHGLMLTAREHVNLFRGGVTDILLEGGPLVGLQTLATNRTIPEWLFSRQIPATHRLNLSRPDAILVVPARAQATQVPATHFRYE